MDEKFSRRFKSFCNSLNALAEARQRDLSDSAQRDKCQVQYHV